MATTIMGYIETTKKIHSLIPTKDQLVHVSMESVGWRVLGTLGP